jgi:cyclopropane fatty-acyl-phospholipid synthase-like methyltransferase
MTWDHLAADCEDYQRRNADQHEPDVDPLQGTIDRIHQYSPIRDVLEIGAGNGWRLRRIAARYGCTVDGIDLSESAAQASRGVVRSGKAPDSLQAIADQAHDLVILGFFAYLLPRTHLLRLAAETDRILQPGGHVAIIDFLHPYPIRRPYGHDRRLQVYKHDLSALFTGLPEYVLIDRHLANHHAHRTDNRDPDRWITVDAIRKLDTTQAYGG